MGVLMPDIEHRTFVFIRGAEILDLGRFTSLDAATSFGAAHYPNAAVLLLVGGAELALVGATTP